jgi:peptidoglycan/LPS O-acetylase OafA/YrhL
VSHGSLALDTTSPRRSSRRADVQGLRAIAVIIVIAYHAGVPIHGGFTGVDLFFVVSGFVITRMVIGELESSGRVRIPAFFARRVKRLLPALALMCLVTMSGAFVLTTGDAYSQTAGSARAAIFSYANLFFYANAGDYFGVASNHQPLLHTWSLSVEEQFYLVLIPLIAAVCQLARRVGAPTRTAAGIAMAVVGVASLGLAILLAGGSAPAHIRDPVTFAFYQSPARAWEFLAGGLVALAESRLLTLRHTRAAGALATAGFAGIAVGALLARSGAAVPSPALGASVLGTAALIAAATASPQATVARVLASPPLVAIGDMSYSLYLWHWPLIVLGAVVLGRDDRGFVLALLSIGPAWLAYRYVETPLRYTPRITGRSIAALGAGCAALVVLTTAAMSSAQHDVGQRAGIDDLDAALSRLSLIRSGGCTAVAGEPGLVRCARGSSSGAQRLLLIGDSQALALAYGVKRAAARRGMEFDALTANGCLVVPLTRARSPHSTSAALTPECLVRRRTARELLRSHPPDVLIISQWTVYTDTSARPRIALEQRYERAVAVLATSVTRHGGGVVLALPPPGMRRDATTCVTWLRILLGGVRSCLTGSRGARQAEERMPMFRGTLALARAMRHLSVFDPARELCDATSCTQLRGRTLLYRDTEHLSVAGSLALADSIGEVVDRVRPGS